MKQRNAAIRRIVKAIESEYTEEGEFLIWETSVPAIHKDSGIDFKVIVDAFKQLKYLRLIKFRDWASSTNTYLVGTRFPKYNRTWIPAIVAQPYLLKLPDRILKHKSAILRYHSIHYQLQVALFKTGTFVYFGKDLDGHAFSVFMPTLIDILKSIQYRQEKILNLINRNHRKVAVTKVFPEISKNIDLENPKSLEYFVETKGLLAFSDPQGKNITTYIRFLSGILTKNKRIHNSILRSLRDLELEFKKDKSGDIFNPQIATTRKPSQSYIRINSKQVTSKKFKPTKINLEKQQILNAFWNAQKCVFGVFRTLQSSKGNVNYSPELSWRFRKPVSVVRTVMKSIPHPIPPRRLFMAVFSHYDLYLKHFHADVPSHNWYASNEFFNLVEMYAIAYAEIEQFQKGVKQIGRRRILEGEDQVFTAMKKMFFHEFEEKFGMSVIHYFGLHFKFFVDWCLFQAVSDFRIARTSFEHRSHKESSLLSYIRAQVDYLQYKALRGSIYINWIFGTQARSRMEIWVRDRSPDGEISQERVEQLNKFFAKSTSVSL